MVSLSTCPLTRFQEGQQNPWVALLPRARLLVFSSSLAYPDFYIANAIFLICFTELP